jgi:hypothetical protein
MSKSRLSDALNVWKYFWLRIYRFQFKFGIFFRYLAKQATSLYVHSPLLKIQLGKYDSMMNFLCSEVKTIFALKFD